MQTLKTFLLLLSLSLVAHQVFSQEWKQMMVDPQVNFYDVVAAAELYFTSVDKDSKGSGWNRYQRWRYENEPKFYPSGDRSRVDPYFVENAYYTYLKTIPAHDRTSVEGKWRELGPYYIEEVTGHYSCGLGRIEAFHIDRDNPDRIYLGSRSGGFWKSLDGGKTWTGGSTDFLVACGVNSISASPYDADKVLINIRNSQNGTTHGVFRSIDAGNTWQRTAFNPKSLGWGGLGTSDQISQVSYHPVSDNLVFIASSRGLYRSEDNLGSWTNPVIDQDITGLAFHPVNPDVIYAVSSSSSVIYISRDGGKRFNISHVIYGNSSNFRISVSAACPDCVFLASDDGIWKSEDEGRSFHLVSDPQIENYGGFAVSDIDANIILTGNYDVHMSYDGGKHFEAATIWYLGNSNYASTGKYVHADIRGAQCIEGIFWIYTDGFLCKSEDNGGTWQLFEGQSIRENYRLGVSQSNTYRTICGSQDNGTSIRTETGWIEFYGADGMEGIIHPLNDDWMIGSYQYAGRRRTKDGGISQEKITPGFGTGAWVAPLLYDPNDHMVIYDFRNSVLRSHDFGTNWEKLASLPEGITVSNASIAQNNSDIIAITYCHNVDLSRDGGRTFFNINSNLPELWITDIGFAPRNDSMIVVVYSSYQNDNNKVFITYDLGNIWHNISYNLSNLPVRCVVIDHTSESNIYLGTEAGVYFMSESDSSWTRFGSGLPGATVNDLEICYGANSIRAATWGRGLWECPLEGRENYPRILTTRISDPPTDRSPKIYHDQYVISTIEYDGLLTSVYVAWSLDEPVFDNIIEMVNMSDSIWISDYPINQPDKGGVKVYIKVIAVGSSNDTSETYKFMYTTQPLDYCKSSAWDHWYVDDSITLVNLHDLRSFSGRLGGYTDYTGKRFTHLVFDTVYHLKVSLAMEDWDDHYAFVKAWIDWNKDGDFYDPGEVYDLGVAVASGPPSQSPVEIRVPLDAAPGKTTMRITCSYGDPPEPCDTAFAGEVEDYSIIIDPIVLVKEVDTVICSSDSIFLGGAWQRKPGVYHDLLRVSDIVDSLIITTLDVVDIYEVRKSYFGCDSLSFPDGTTFYQSIDTTVYLSGANAGCDTAVHLDIQIGYDTQTEISVFSCGPYFPPSGNTIYIIPGIYYDVVQNSTDCDSIIKINFSATYINTAVDVQGHHLISQSIDATYQWINCETMEPVIGEVDRSFEPTIPGSYAVILSQGECVDTSSCYQITTVSVEENSFDHDIQYFPNPTSGEILVVLGEAYQDVFAEIFNIDGHIIETMRLGKVSSFNLDIPGPAGHYMVKLSDINNKQKIIRVVKY